MDDNIFDTLTILNDLVENVENVCSICGGSGHYAQECPDFIKGYHVEDTPLKNLSRSSVPNGLLILDRSEGGTCVITSQKFAKGTRFGPLYAEKSYVPLKTLSKFPLIIYPDSQIAFDDLQTTTTASLQEIFSIRNIYLDISNEQKCNWMIHVNHAEYSNEQNLICYQENRQIYYTAIQDLELGDILKVWYSPCYAQKIGIQPQELPPSKFVICNNILQQVSIDYGINLNEDIQKMNEDNYYLQYSTAATLTTTSTVTSTSYSDAPETPTLDTNNWYTHNSSSSQEIALPPINSLIKTSSPNYSSNFYDLDASFGATTSAVSMPAAIAGALYDLNADLNGTSFDSTMGGGSSVLDTSNSNMSELFLNESVTYAPLGQQPDTTMQLTMGQTMMDSNNNTSKEDGSNKVKFTCEKCSKKYMTKSNLEKHLRIHDLFMCVVCMKIHSSTDELKEHACFKKKAKNSFHCDVCLKVLSNSWSLQRHMKIHRPTDPTNPTAMLSTSHTATLAVEDISNPQSYEQSSSMSSPPHHIHQLHYEQLQQPHQSYEDSTIKDEIFDSDVEATTMIEHADMDGIVIKPIPCDDDFDDLIKIHSNNGAPRLQYETMVETPQLPPPLPPPHHLQTLGVAEKKKKMKEDREKGVLHSCIVCSRAFKNPNALEKHLRNVHTVNVLVTTPVSGGSHNNVLKLDAMPGAGSYKNYKESRKSVLNTSTPIKPSIAKALANKLTEKNNKRMLESSVVQIEPGQVDVESPSTEYQTQYDSYQIETLNVSPTSHQQLQQYDYTDGASPTGGNGNNNNTIIIISNVELNNSLIDTSQLFINQNSMDLKLYNPQSGGVAAATDNLPKLVPISSAKSNHNLYVPAGVAKTEDLNPESPQLFVIPKDKPIQYSSGSGGEGAPLIKHSHSSNNNSILTTTTNTLANVSNINSTTTDISQMHHQKSQHQNFDSDQIHTCDECDKTFKKKYQLVRHQETHGSIFYYCPFCDRTPVKAKSSLKKHFARDHPDKANEWNHPGTGFINELVVRDAQMLQQLQQKGKLKLNAKRAALAEEAGPEQSTNNLEIAAAAAAAAVSSNLTDRYFFNQNSSNSCSTLDSNSKNDTMLSFEDIMFTTGDQYQQQQQQPHQQQGEEGQHIIINATSTNLANSDKGTSHQPKTATMKQPKVKKERKTKVPVAINKPPKISKKKVKEAMKRKYENISDDSTTNCDLSATSNNNLKHKSNNNNKNSLNLMNNVNANSSNLYEEQRHQQHQQQQQSYEFTNLPNSKKPKLPNGAIYNTSHQKNNSSQRIVTMATPSTTSSLTYNTNNGGNTFLATNLVFRSLDDGKQVTAVAASSSGSQPPVTGNKATPDAAIIIDNLFDNISMDDNNLLKYTLTSDDFTDDPTNNIIIDTDGDYIQEKFQNSFNQIQEKLDADDLDDFRADQLKWSHDDDNANDLMDDDRADQLSSTSSNDHTNKLLEMEDSTMLL